MNDGIELTLLSEEEIWGDKQLDVLRQYGTKSAITDLVVLTGGYCEDSCTYMAPDDNSLKGRTSWFYTRFSDGDGDVRGVYRAGSGNWSHRYGRNGAVRPALLSSIVFSQISPNRVRGYNAPDSDMQRRLESEYQRGNLRTTGRDYTFDRTKYNDYDQYFQPVKYEEYEYQGRRYIRVQARSHYDGGKFKLSNGIKYRDGDNVWVEVSPVVWLIDDRTKTLVSKRGILSGIRFHTDKKRYNGDFSTTEMKEYFDKYMLHDLFQSVTYIHNNEMIREDRKNFDVNLLELNNVLNSREEALKIVREVCNNFKGLDIKYRSDREIAMEAVIMDGLLLKYVSEDLKSDIEIVKIALRFTPMAFEFVSNKFKDDEKLVLDVVSRCGDAIRFASPRLRHNKDIVLVAVRNDGRALSYVPNFSDDRDIVFEAIKQDGRALLYANKKFFSDKEIMLEVVRKPQSAYLIAFASDELKDDMDIIRTAYSVNKAYLKYASDRIKDEFRLSLIKDKVDSMLGSSARRNR